MQSDNLKEHDDNFQAKLIASFITDKFFFQQVIDVIDPKHFTTEMDQFVVKLMFDHFLNYKQLPTSTVLKTEINKIKDDVLRTSIYDRLKKVRSVVNATDLSYVKEEYLKFCLTKEIESALIKSADLLQVGELDGIKTLVNTAFNSISDRDLGHDYLKGFEERYEKDIRNPIPTPWPVINKIMDGGLSGGEVACAIAPSGRGKSWILSAIGSHALKIGKNVLHYTLEINEHYVAKRYDSIYSGVPFSELRFKKEEVFNSIKTYNESTLIIKKYGGKKASIQTLVAHIEKCINNGMKPDLLVIDYADLLKPTIYHNKESYAVLQDIYVDLCGLAEDYNIPCWTASQTSRAGISADIIEEDLIAGSYGKVMESYFVMTLSRNVTDKQGGTAKIFVAKNRFGPDGLTFPSKFNASNGKILIYEKDSVEGKRVSKELEEDITVRTELRDRFNDLMGKEKKSDEEKIDLG